MTDRELLELAARAAGIGFYAEQAPSDGSDALDTPSGWWHPLIDDGDAFRLAVDLGLSLIVSRDADGTPWAAVCSGWAVKAAECGGDIRAAARRVIVQAAADLVDQWLDVTTMADSEPVYIQREGAAP